MAKYESPSEKQVAGELVVDEPDVDEPEAAKPEADEPEADEPEVDEPKADEPEADEPEADEPEVEEESESCGEAPSKLEEAGAKIGGGISSAETLPVFEAGLVQEDQGSKALAGQDQVPML